MNFVLHHDGQDTFIIHKKIIDNIYFINNQKNK